MKKNSTLIAIAFMAIMTVGFLTANAQPWVIGGNAVGANSSFGTNTNFSVVFKTNNTDRGRITNGGNWAIGSTGTASKLTVNSLVGITPFRAQINGSSKLIVSGNGSVSVGSGTAGPANGLYVAGNVGIGTAAPLYKLQVIGNASFSNQLVVGNGGSYGYNSNGPGVFGSGSGWGVYGTSPNTGVYGQSTASGNGVWGTSAYIGVLGQSTGQAYGVYGTSGHIAVYGVGTDASSYGVYGYSPGGGGSDPFWVSGVYGYNGSNGYGVGGYCESGSGVFGYSTNYVGVWGRTANTSSYAGYFVGNVFSTGSYQGSDQKLKKNVAEMEGGLDILKKLQVKTYEYRQDGNYKLMNLPVGTRYGLIAQDVEQILPGLVKDTEFDTKMALPPLKQEAGKPTPASGGGEPTEIIKFKAVNYTELIPVLIQAIKEQEAKIEALTELVNKLKSPNSRVTVNSASLGQSFPNPNKNNTRIEYNIPDGSGKGVLVINDANGKKIKQIVLSKGNSAVNINTAALSSGTYFYSLLLDGATIDTKKMIIAR